MLLASSARTPATCAVHGVSEIIGLEWHTICLPICLYIDVHAMGIITLCEGSQTTGCKGCAIVVQDIRVGIVIKFVCGVVLLDA